MLVNIPQPDSPAALLSTRPTTSDLLSAVKLKNVSEMALSGCRLGWVIVFSSGKNEIHTGLPINISLSDCDRRDLDRSRAVGEPRQRQRSFNNRFLCR